MITRRGGIKKRRESVKSEACIDLVGCEDITVLGPRRAHNFEVHRFFFFFESTNEINHSASEWFCIIGIMFAPYKGCFLDDPAGLHDFN